MSISNVTVQTTQILTLSPDSLPTTGYLPVCDLKWRKKILWVKKLLKNNNYSFSALTSKQWLEDCLRNSWVTKVCLDRSLGEEEIRLWADTCYQSKKPVFVRIPSHSEFPNCRQTIHWRIKRFLDWLIALTSILWLSPLLLAIALLIKIFTPGPVLFSQWRVGERGKLFKIYKFRTMAIDAESLHHQVMGEQTGLHKLEKDPRITGLGKWLRKFSLDELPQLFNVLKGEMTLVGPRPWALYDALRLSKKSQKRLNVLPGITGAWQIKTRSGLLDLDAVTQYDLEYLYGWSLVEDLKILLLTIPKVIIGSGAY